MPGQPQAVFDERTGVLADTRMVSLVVYVRDVERSRDYYERLLGLTELSACADEARYDVGPVTLVLRRAADDGVPLPEGHDDASDVVFLVDDADAARSALERRGVEFAHRRTYGIGVVTDFYDPDGHRLMIYEPSGHALETPAGPTLRRVWREHGHGDSGRIGPAAGPALEGLAGKPLVYVFVFVHEIGATRRFYEDTGLGMSVMDRSHCCNDACPDDEKGVVKYEAGEVILSTHHLHGHEAVRDDHGQAYGAREFSPADAKGVAPVLAVDDLTAALEALGERGIEPWRSPRPWEKGVAAGVVAPSGHLLYLHEAAP